jgi:hypothetical protein
MSIAALLVAVVLWSVMKKSQRHDAIPGQTAAAETHEDHMPEADMAKAVFAPVPIGNAGDLPAMSSPRQLDAILTSWPPDDGRHPAYHQRSHFPWG